MIDAAIKTDLRDVAAVKTRLPWPVWLLCGLLLGNLMMKRSFAHLGFAPLYVAEIVLFSLVLFRPDVIVQPWLKRLFSSGPLTAVAYSAVIFLVYGALQCLRGLDGIHKMAAIQNFVFFAYVVFLFAGVWVGQNYPDLMRKLMYVLSWAVGVYGVLYLVLLADRAPVDDLSTAPVATFGQPGGAAIAILALLAFETSWKRISIPLMLNAFTLLGNQVRAEWLAFTVAVIAFAFLTRSFGKLMPPALAVFGLLLFGLVTDFRVTAPNARGGEISTRDIVGRAVAAVDEKAASYITPRADTYAATVSWRTSWWQNIYRSVHRDTFTMLFGHGLSFAIWELHPEGITIVRTPHNIAVFCLAYGGWIGVFVYYFFHIQLGIALWRAFRLTGNAFGICLWIAFTVWAPFDNLMEAPYGAIPFYLMCGMQLAPLLRDDCEASTDRKHKEVLGCG